VSPDWGTRHSPYLRTDQRKTGAKYRSTLIFVSTAAAIAISDGVLTRNPGAWFVVNAGSAHPICAMTAAAAAVITLIPPGIANSPV
jgi:hypothetical protein